MNFLFLTSHYYPIVFGAELFAQRLAERLVNEGHEVHVITGEWNDDWELHESVNGVLVHRIRSPHVRYLQNLLYIQPQLSFAKYLMTKHRFDFVHAHIYPSLFNGFRLDTKDQLPRTIVTIQGGDLGDYPEIYDIFAPIAKRLIANSIKNYDVIHAVSTDLNNQITSMTGHSAIVIPNGIDPITSSSVTSPLSLVPSTKIVAFSPSRLTNKNNLKETIKAIKILRDQKIDIGLAIAGVGHQQDELEQLIKDYHLEKYVSLIGIQPHETVLQLIKKSDLVVRVSLQEGFGIALLEAMAQKTPVVASRAGGLADFVSEDTAFVPAGPDAQAIADAMRNLIEFKGLREKRVANAFKLSQEYTWKTITSRCMKELYGIR